MVQATTGSLMTLPKPDEHAHHATRMRTEAQEDSNMPSKDEDETCCMLTCAMSVRSGCRYAMPPNSAASLTLSPSCSVRGRQRRVTREARMIFVSGVWQSQQWVQQLHSLSLNVCGQLNSTQCGKSASAAVLWPVIILLMLSQDVGSSSK